MAHHQGDDYIATWICALPLELAAARTMLDEQNDPLPLDSRLPRQQQLRSWLNSTVSAARVVKQMLSTFKQIKFGLMIGIGGGAPSAQHDIRPGDVVVASPTGMFGGVIEYDFGKTVQEGRFQRTGMLNKPPEVLLAALSNLQVKHLMGGHQIEKTIQAMVTRYPVMSWSQILRGKSTLIAFLIQRLTRFGEEHDHTFYFFFKDTDGSKSKPAQALRTLMSLLLDADEDNRLLPWLEKARLQSYCGRL